MADSEGATAPITKAEDLIGRYVIARCSGAGVHAGTLVAFPGTDGVVLANSRRLWRWWAGEGAFLSGVATYGLHTSEKKTSSIGAPADIVLNGVHELILCTDKAARSIAEYPSHVAN